MAGFVKHASKPEDSVLNNFDFTILEDMDPQISKCINSLKLEELGYEVLFDREAPFELRIHDPSKKSQIEVGNLEAIRIRVLMNVSTDESDLKTGRSWFASNRECKD